MRKTGADFQERGGPRSVSGEPIEETTISAFNGAETLPPVCLSGDEILNSRLLPNIVASVTLHRAVGGRDAPVTAL